jgi:hypothetical protein
MKIVPDRIVSLGFGKYVRADRIVALVPIEEDRGSGRRTLVYVAGLPEPLLAGRTEDASDPSPEAGPGKESAAACISREHTPQDCCPRRGRNLPKLTRC